MFQDFISSWPLFHNTYISGCLIALLLSVVGVLVVARDQIFFGAAVAQASTLGIALAMQIGGVLGLGIPWLEDEVFITIMAVLFCVVASLLTWQGAKLKRESYEALTGWIFLISASASILVLAKSPHGLEEIYRLLSSSIIGATEIDVALFSSFAAFTLICLLLQYPRILLLAMDPEMAVSVGMNRRKWEIAISVWLGLVVGLSMRSSGMIYTFGCLVLPALISKSICGEVLSMFVTAPLIVGVISIAGFVLSNHYDYPPAHLTVACLCSLLGAAWMRQRFRSEL